jgi:hypothetical protein
MEQGQAKQSEQGRGELRRETGKEKRGKEKGR